MKHLEPGSDLYCSGVPSFARYIGSSVASPLVPAAGSRFLPRTALHRTALH